MNIEARRENRLIDRIILGHGESRHDGLVEDHVTGDVDLPSDRVIAFPCVVLVWIANEDASSGFRLEVQSLVLLNVDPGPASENPEVFDRGLGLIPYFMRCLPNNSRSRQTIQDIDEGEDSISPKG